MSFENVFWCFAFLCVCTNGCQLYTENFVNWITGVLQEQDENSKLCRYRDMEPAPVAIFNLVAGAGCYSYSEDAWIDESVGKYRISWGSLTVNNITYRFPATVVNESCWFVYDYTDGVAKEFIAKSFNSKTYTEKWTQCARSAAECCSNVMTNENIESTEEYSCPATWDAWSCFPPAKSGHIVQQPCNSFIYSNDGPSCTFYSQKECHRNGTWNQQTDYSTCDVTTFLETRHHFHIVCLSVSIGICVPALVIFFVYRELRILRVILHRNLILSIVVKNMFVIISKSLVILDALETAQGSVMEQNGVPCRVLAVFERIAINAMYACMLVDALYLHKMIVAVFRKDPDRRILYGIVAGFAIIPNVWWISMMATQSDRYCWMVDTSWYTWINDSVRYFMLGINTLLLINIVRVLFFKLRHNSNANHTKTTLRATLILLPLFGVQFILNSQHPDVDSCNVEQGLFYLTYLLDGLQGITVSLLYCFINREVRTLLYKNYTKLRIKLENKYGLPSRRLTKANRRNTAATYVRSSEIVSRPSDILASLEVPQENSSRILNWLRTTKINPPMPLSESNVAENKPDEDNDDQSSGCGSMSSYQVPSVSLNVNEILDSVKDSVA